MNIDTRILNQILAIYKKVNPAIYKIQLKFN